MTLIVAKDGPVKTVQDLKGETVSISSPGGVPEWLVRELSRKQGWGPSGINMVGLGADSAQVAAMRTGQVVGMPSDIGLAMKLQDEGVTRILVHFGDIVPSSLATRSSKNARTIYADFSTAGSRQSAICARIRPTWSASVRRSPTFLPTLKGRVDDVVMPMFSETGQFDPQAVAVLARSFVDLKLLPSEPDMSKLYTEKFLPPAATIYPSQIR